MAKPWTLALLAACLAAPPLVAGLDCPETERELLYLAGAPVEDATESICADPPLLPSGRIVCREGADLFAAGRNRRYRVEKGQIDGIGYEIFFINAAGIVQGAPEVVLGGGRHGLDDVWTLACERAAPAGASCKLSRGRLEAGVRLDGDVFVELEGWIVSARVDGQEPMTPAGGGFSGTESLALLQQMVAGEWLVYGYRDEFSELGGEAEVPLYGLAAAWEVLTAVWEGVCDGE